MQRSGTKLTSNESVDESDKDGNRISCSALCRKIRNFLLRLNFKKFLIVGLFPILTLAICPFFSDLQSIEDKIRQFPQETLVFTGFYYLVIATWGIWTTISDVKDKAKKSFEHKILFEIQPTWLRKQEAFVPCESGEKIKNQTHKDSVDELEKVGMPGIEGGAAFVAIIILLFTLVAVLFTTLSYFMIGATFNLVEKNDGFLFVNNEGFTAAMTLLVVLVAAAVVPVYTDLGKTISERLNSFEEEISNISRNLLLIGQRMDPVWDHYQSVTNRFVPEWFLTIQENLVDGDYQSFRNDLKASLKIDDLFDLALRQNIGIEPFHEKAFLALGQEFARLEPSGIFLKGVGTEAEANAQNPKGKKRNKKLSPDAEKLIKTRLEEWTLSSEKENVLLDDVKIKKEIKNCRRFLAYQTVENSKPAIPRIADYFPPSEWEVSLLLGDRSTPETPDETSNLYKYFGESLESYFGHHMKAVLDLKEEGDRSLSSLCLKSDISTDIFLDDYHLFTTLLLENNEKVDLEWSQKRAREIYYAIFFFTSQDSQSIRSQRVRAFKKNKNTEIETGQVFFQELFSDICSWVKESKKYWPDDSQIDQQQLLMDLTYERGALHNWIRASQSVTRRKVWIELSNELSNKVKNRKVIPSLWGLPIVPTRDRRLHDLMRHAGVPIIDKERLRLLSLKEISEEEGKKQTKRHIEKILIENKWTLLTRAQIIKLDNRSVRYEEFIKAIPGLNKKQKNELRVDKSVWNEVLLSEPSDTAINFWKYFLIKVDQKLVLNNRETVRREMIKKLDENGLEKCINDLLKKEKNYFENDCELIRRLKFLDPISDEIWMEFTNKVTKEDLTRKTLKKYSEHYEKLKNSKKSQLYRTVASDKIEVFKRSLQLEDRPGIGKKEYIFSFELKKVEILSFELKKDEINLKINAAKAIGEDVSDLEKQLLELKGNEIIICSEFGEKVNVSLEAALEFATKMFKKTLNPFWCSFKESYLEREESNLKRFHPVEVEGKDFKWRRDGLVWNIALESIHTPDLIPFENKAHIGHPKKWLEYSLKQCEKLGFTSVAHAYIVNAVKEWDKDETLDDKNSCEIEGPDGLTTWKKINDKWKVTAHSFKIINPQDYIWRLSIANSWNIALESMHTPSPEVEKSVKNWLEYSLKQCEKLGFTSVDHDYLKEAVAVWSKDTDWSTYEDVKNSSNFKKEGPCWNQQKT